MLLPSVTRATSKLVRNVKDYGAVGNGVADDTTAIHAARTAATAGDTLFFPAGTYNTTGLSINKRLTLVLDQGAILYLISASNNPVVWFTVTGCRIRGGTLNGNRAGQSSGNAGIYAPVSDTIIEDVAITGTFAQGIAIGDASNVRIRRCRVDDTGDLAIFYETGSGTTANIEIIDCEVDRSAEGIGIVGGGIMVKGVATTAPVNDVRVADNRVLLPTNPTSFGLCIELFGNVNRGSVTGNVTSGGIMGISLDRTSQVACAGNTTYNAKTVGIEIASGDRTNVTGNTVDGNSLTATGISCTNTTPDNNSITSNTIYGCATKGMTIQSSTGIVVSGNNVRHAGTASGIELLNSARFTVTGNMLDGVVTASQGVTLDKSNHGAITGNTIEHFTTYGVNISIDAAGTLDYVTAEGNTIYSCGTPIREFASTGTIGQHVITTPNNTDGSSDVASAATLTLPLWTDYVNVTGTTQITNLATTGAWIGRLVTLRFASTAGTSATPTNAKQAGILNSTTDDTISYRFDGTNWTEVGRSVNA